jgi:hypothetical protein
VVNLDLPDIEPNPEEVRWVDDMRAPQAHPNSVRRRRIR